MSTLKPGSKIPDLSGASADGDIRLRDIAVNKFAIVYFYPKDNTTGCTRQAQDFRDLAGRFTKSGAVIAGVSRDSVKSHAGFSKKQDLNFILVSDANETWCRAFDVIHEKVLYGRRYMGIVRSTFLFDPAGRLIHEWRGVKVPGHAAAVLEIVDAARA